VERIAPFPKSVLGCSLITATQWFVSHISGVVLPGQAEIDEIVVRGPLRPGEPFGLSFEVPTSIDIDGVKSFRVHPRRIEHDVIRCAITENVLYEGSPTKATNVPVCNISFVHEFKTLAWRIVRSTYAYEQAMCWAHLTDLGEERHELAKCLEMGFMKWAQEGHHHQFLVGDIGQFDNL
jgi:hypothetical protein